eukprot:3940745-Rhodomonas_salina.9
MVVSSRTRFKPMSGTDVAHGAICLRAPYAMSGTGIAHRGVRCPVLTRGMVSAVSGQTQRTVTSLRACYAMPGTDLAYGAMPMGNLLWAYALSMQSLVLSQSVRCYQVIADIADIRASLLETPFDTLLFPTELLGTTVADAVDGVRACHVIARCTTHVAVFAVLWLKVSSAISLRACYAMSGTEIVYEALPAYVLAMRCPLLN